MFVLSLVLMSFVNDNEISVCLYVHERAFYARTNDPATVLFMAVDFFFKYKLRIRLIFWLLLLIFFVGAGECVHRARAFRYYISFHWWWYIATDICFSHSFPFIVSGWTFRQNARDDLLEMKTWNTFSWHIFHIYIYRVIIVITVIIFINCAIVITFRLCE